MNGLDNGWTRYALQFIATCFAVGAALGLLGAIITERMANR